MGAINIKPEKHHGGYKKAFEQFDRLIGMDEQKQLLLSHLELVMNPDSITNWQKKHHSHGLSLLDRGLRLPRLVILSGEVGCGKSELAACVASKLSERLNYSEVMVYHAPSDLRGSGLVGELSGRITTLFDQVKADKKHQYHILVIDEADDVVNSRENDHQHHEDRSGVNALIKELDALEKEQSRIAVIFISNRSNTFDPAVLRRSALEIFFGRPESTEIRTILEILTGGIQLDVIQINQLVEECLRKRPLFTYSDFFNRIGINNLINAKMEDRPLGYDDIMGSIRSIVPSPQFRHHEKR
ncbi:AAA family ATPase [Fluviicola taffensis]|uniref:AAA ATPase central domain protein n=1 Tax=Fluviicola taffensis (strain DSM 16823 / NCIMB 13979 / RW262) TaxID=755732 RepID=F2IEA7_FLUTR|nr:ATP-binding protein [Fluviicola taffensis]AEA42425.1 AAA ATPase central domain protein [Fluviicola taffensis DSM 16823]